MATLETRQEAQTPEGPLVLNIPDSFDQENGRRCGKVPGRSEERERRYRQDRWVCQQRWR